MRKTLHKALPVALAQFVLLFALVAPKAITQESCEVDQGLRDLVDKTFADWNDKKPPEQSKIYVSHLSFMDGFSKTLLISNEAALIDEAVQDGMQQAASTNSNIVVNESGHTVPNSDATVSRLAEIAYNPNLTPEEKYREAVSALLDPYGVDVLVTGVVIDTGTVIQINPIGVSKPDELIRTKARSFAGREELFQEVNGTLTLTDKGREEITKAVKDLLENS